MKSFPVVLLILCILVTTGCKTYHITTESLMIQFAKTNPEYKKMDVVAGGVGRIPFFVVFPWPYKVKGNDLRELTVLDKNGKEHILTVNHHTGVKITKTDGRHTTFYFNTLLMSDSFISGNKTHFFNAPIKKIKFAEVSKIEVQR